jgi:8-oxo-dGTP pyrophosphatase MutT (NUDIX family)
MTAAITPATALLSGVMPHPAPGFAPFWFRNERVGAVAPGWIDRLDPQIFHVEPRPGEPLPHVALKGVDRRRDASIVPIESVNQALQRWAERLRDAGFLPGYRDEAILVYGATEAQPLFRIERALLRPLGLLLRTVQLNVFVLEDRGLSIWVARRSATKAVDPGRLDCLVGGGIRGGDTPLATLLRECQEEAGIPRQLARRAIPVGVIDSIAAAGDAAGAVLHRERAMLYDLKVGPDFRPELLDGEIEEAALLEAEIVNQQIAAGYWTAEAAWAAGDLIRRLGVGNGPTAVGR